jgi:hypothetical protein
MEHPDSFNQERVRRPFGEPFWRLRWRLSVRGDKPSHVASRVSGPSHEGDERDYAQSLTCCF